MSEDNRPNVISDSNEIKSDGRKESEVDKTRLTLWLALAGAPALFLRSVDPNGFAFICLVTIALSMGVRIAWIYLPVVYKRPIRKPVCGIAALIIAIYFSYSLFQISRPPEVVVSPPVSQPPVGVQAPEPSIKIEQKSINSPCSNFGAGKDLKVDCSPKQEPGHASKKPPETKP